ncbi:amidohydrolase family protein [Rothia uropygioeca]|uniref:amidohydrolase family protein n=1 Tax=Kocuria sp. 257 TaxID=2021970 RepID=UPI0013EC3AF6|nr:amidohydrolase family protein [Kocuria sp. 257]
MKTLITSVSVFNGEILLEGRHDVVFDQSGILSIEPAGSMDQISSDTTVDGTGRTLVPGFIDSHVHITDPNQLDDLLKSGITTAMDMAMWPYEFQQQIRREGHGTNILTAGAPLVSHHGTHARIPNFPEESMTDDAHRARGLVKERVDQGSDYIKLILESPGNGGLDLDVAQAAVDEAHRAGKLVVAHAIAVGAYETGVRIGVDILTHAPLDRGLPPTLIAEMVQKGIVSSPTLTMMKGTAEFFADQGSDYRRAAGAVSDMHEAGAILVAGTDANQAPGVPANVVHGVSLHEEFHLLNQAGLSPVEVLQSATSLNARTFRLDDRGVVEPGKRADLVLVAGDPTHDVMATREIQAVWLGGRNVEGTK